jgi:hypothetical protein
MNIDLHKQKVEILSRLIKETSLTLEEALVLLKEEEQVVVNQPVISPYPLSGTYCLVSGDSISCTNVDSSTWNSTVSQALVDETPTL